MEKAKEKKEIGGAVKAYLLAYNFIQAAGWAYILFKVANNLYQPRTPLWDDVGRAVSIFQNAAALEIIHSALGMVKTPLATTLVQVFSRVALVFITNNVPDVQHHWILYLMLFSWSITEVVRYLFYGFSLLGNVPYVLGWLRYTLFIVLYPSGVSGEVGCILASLPYVKATKLYSVEMPNQYNFAFNFHYALIASLPLYVVGLPWLYMHMLRQRKRFVSGPAPASDKPKTH